MTGTGGREKGCIPPKSLHVLLINSAAHLTHEVLSEERKLLGTLDRVSDRRISRGIFSIKTFLLKDISAPENMSALYKANIYVASFCLS